MAPGLTSIFNDFNKKISAYFNPVGVFYKRFVIMFRVLLVNVFLKDLFAAGNNNKNIIACETKQVGCEISCMNRFNPIMHNQLWNFELLCTSLALTFFVSINYFNQYRYQKLIEKEIDLNLTTFRKKKGVVISAYTVVGYSGMLIIRLILELWCVYLEYNLALHHSQNENNSLSLKEKWLCPVYNPNSHISSTNFHDKFLPIANRSVIFHRDDRVEACLQQEVSVTCWIAQSRMKTLGIKLMFGFMCAQTIFTVLELLVEICKMCMGDSGLSVPKNKNDEVAIYKAQA